MTADVLSARALGRATLQRQLLLGCSHMEVLDAVGHLVGMQQGRLRRGRRPSGLLGQVRRG